MDGEKVDWMVESTVDNSDVLQVEMKGELLVVSWVASMVDGAVDYLAFAMAACLVYSEAVT